MKIGSYAKIGAQSIQTISNSCQGSIKNFKCDEHKLAVGFGRIGVDYALGKVV